MKTRTVFSTHICDVRGNRKGLIEVDCLKEVFQTVVHLYRMQYGKIEIG